VACTCGAFDGDLVGNQQDIHFSATVVDQLSNVRYNINPKKKYVLAREVPPLAAQTLLAPEIGMGVRLSSLVVTVDRGFVCHGSNSYVGSHRIISTKINPKGSLITTV
jgi:hypothetical protein